MMADLQNIAPKPGMVSQERLLGRLLRISHQQDGSAAGLKQSDQRAVIYPVSRDILRRTEERERSAALQRERLAVIRDEGRESAPAERRIQPVALRFRTHVKAAHGKRAEHLLHAADMVGVGMRRDDGVEPAHAETFQLAHERRCALRCTGIHEDRAAARNEQRAVTLAYIKKIRGVLLGEGRGAEPSGKQQSPVEQERRRCSTSRSRRTRAFIFIPRRNGTSQTRR